MTELVTLRQLFVDGTEERFFRIPDYQRGYSWESHHRDDLLKDLEELAKHKTQHFTGTIVAARPTQKGEPYSVVDGQQRLTTLTILMARLLLAIRDRAIDPVQVDVDASWNHFVCKEERPGHFEWRLTLSSDQSDLFRRLLDRLAGKQPTTGAKSKADVNLMAAVAQFDDYIAAQKDTDLVQLYSSIADKLGFLLYAPENHKEIGLMFEVINNRGKRLSELEKVKNYLIYYANRNGMTELHDNTNAAWGRILSGLNRIGFTENQDEERFLRACWIVYNDPRKSESQYVYEGIKRVCECEKRNSEEVYQFLRGFVDWLDRSIVTFQRLYDREANTGATEEDRILERISYHPSRAAIIPLILAVMHAGQDASARAKALDLIEKLNFRYYVTGIAPRSDSKQGILFGLAHSFFWGIESQTQKPIADVNWLIEELVRFVVDHAARKSFVKHLTLDLDESGDYYGWQGLRFFLASYEDSLRSDRSQGPDLAATMKSSDRQFHNDSFQKEHILARNDFTATKEADDINKRRLGNFVLLREGTNKSAKDKPIQEKIRDGYTSQETSELYQIQELEQFMAAANAFVFDERGWKRKTPAFWYELYQKFLDLREEKLVNFALTRWAVPEVEGEPARVGIDSFEANNEIFSFQ